jgi:(p)ppGpp synthase/HD superfamily hydrolase
MKVVERAAAFADQAHMLNWQKRRYTGEPYIEHPREVVSILMDHTWEESTLAAAWLHDVVEDTPYTIEHIQKVFGQGIAAIVQELTDPSLPGLNRASRTKLKIERLANASPEAQAIKLADMLSNVRTIVQHDPKFARVYLPEMRALFAVLVHAPERLRSDVDRALAMAEAELEVIKE